MRAPILFLALAVTVTVAFAQSNETTLIARGSGTFWKYLDDGSAPPIAWNQAAFDDHGWKTGASPLGYGDPDVATEISYGTDARAKHITAYFRHEFEVTDAAAVRRLRVLLRVDDGAILYLNGQELRRENMPPGTPTPGTLTPRAIGGSEETIYHQCGIAPTALRSGRNVLAAGCRSHPCGAISGCRDKSMAMPGTSSCSMTVRR
jgi:hypothetical protein